MWRLQISQGNVENTESKSQTCIHVKCLGILSSAEIFLCNKILHKTFRNKKQIMVVVTLCFSLSSNNVMS